MERTILLKNVKI